ncbi:hypothetical protein [Nitrosopumilus sp.]|uniref:hypothetical protein n=1 Tax=Nitrosopumilus sp. TaxID=2024843 RepID=UPI003D0B7C5B
MTINLVIADQGKYIMDPLNKNLVSLAVEKALLEMGKIELKMVESKLTNEYQIKIDECMENPTCLKQILQEMFGNAYTDILKSIENSFEKLTLDEEMTNFITVLRN